MGVESTISEGEAVKQAGVSARTLQRFSEAGYLSVQVQSDGSRLYSLQQLNEIFGSFQESAPSAPSRPERTEDESCASGPSCSHNATTYYTPAEPTPLVEKVSTEAFVSPTLASRPASHDEELARLKNLVSLQERILDMKDSEIKDLRSQRDWLKTRVEKLEEKGDRDQVLLLSETQALRQLIGLQQKKTSTLRSLLDWLGLGSPEAMPALPSNQDIATATNGQGTIVVNKVANG
jgi:hypothetical protein